ncbi:hypothetical protein D8674_033611 [Pyrus ussuriensis x Pyrus communis]|uniref:Uncharacterized protein n=1 Tax=Pyrus ussuriensis x Pyrus communis TaxID=2448454 RepID=A0A5N5HLI4_9ROSA|nr:hypothetical protein D8674_033611 [Pyrus ussuriensis x Pyrus communis]
MEVEVEVAGTKPSADAKLRRVDSQHKDQLRVKRKTLQAVLEQCQRALESLGTTGGADEEDDGDDDEDDDDNSSRGAAVDDDRRQGRGSTSSLADCEADELCNLLKSRVECPDFLQKLESAHASVPQNIPAEEGNSWDLVSENDLWEDEDSKFGEEDYVLVRQEDIVEGIACFMAAYLLSLKQTKELTPNQLQKALSKTFSVKNKKGKLRKAWDGSKVIYNVASWGATAIGIYQNPVIIRVATKAFWTSCQVISKFL